MSCKGRDTFYSDDTADAQLTQSRHLVGGGPAAGAQHIYAQAKGWFIAPSSQDPAVNDLWIASEVVTFTGRHVGPPVTVVNHSRPTPKTPAFLPRRATTTPAASLGSVPPPGVAFQVQVVKLPNR